MEKEHGRFTRRKFIGLLGLAAATVVTGYTLYEDQKRPEGKSAENQADRIEYPKIDDSEFSEIPQKTINELLRADPWYDEFWNRDWESKGIGCLTIGDGNERSIVGGFCMIPPSEKLDDRLRGINIRFHNNSLTLSTIIDKDGRVSHQPDSNPPPMSRDEAIDAFNMFAKIPLFDNKDVWSENMRENETDPGFDSPGYFLNLNYYDDVSINAWINPQGDVSINYVDPDFKPFKD